MPTIAIGSSARVAGAAGVRGASCSGSVGVASSALGGLDRLPYLRAPGLRVDQFGEIRAARCQQLGS
ncbi:hypothetical protein EAO69_44660 [Streptomyces sp. me109]|uniref:hypothetical protein n=1 Tax=Streptomyces sp. me109 TaxID=1827853 RepID=UPI0011CE25BF|nr:hypothetical protein [Streptomyces sp. me109]TXS51737.1 hypothetical protein EAO69_44660 [Streptomyces sp. me109]